MDIRHLTPTYAVSPQIEPADVAAIRAAGFTTVIDNRPDSEIPEHLQTPAIRAAVEAAGLTFVGNPLIRGAVADWDVAAQGAAIAAAGGGKVLAYCASGNRSSIAWALSQAGRTDADTLIAAAARHGYDLEPYRPLLAPRT